MTIKKGNMDYKIMSKEEQLKEFDDFAKKIRDALKRRMEIGNTSHHVCGYVFLENESVIDSINQSFKRFLCSDDKISFAILFHDTELNGHGE